MAGGPAAQPQVCVGCREWTASGYLRAPSQQLRVQRLSYIAEQLGHEDPGFTFRVYQRAAKRRDRLSAAYREAYDRALDWAAMGSGAGFPPEATRSSTRRQQQESA